MRRELACVAATLLFAAGCVLPEVLDCPCADGFHCQEPEGICVRGSGDGGTDAGVGDLLLHLTCESFEGTTMVDQSGRGNDARCDAAGCPALVPSRDSMACEFSDVGADPSAQRLRVSHREEFLSEELTVTLWVRPTGARSGSVIGKPYANARANSWQMYLPVVGGEVRARFVAAYCPAPEDDCPTAGGEEIISLPDTPIPAGEWTHFAISNDGTTRRAFVDGVEVASEDGEIDIDAHDITIGADDNSGVPDLPYYGLVDDIRIYGRALSDGEIAALAAD